MTTTLPGRLRWAALLAALALGACRATPPTNFYVLTSLADVDAQDGARAESGALLGVGPVELPGYLDQTEIITRSSANGLALADFDHWAEPLQEGITRVLAEDLSALRPLDRIAVFPWVRADPVDLQVIVRVARFEVVADQARLVVEWRLVSGDGRELMAQRSSFVEPVAGTGYADRVEAMSKALANLSKEIAAGTQGKTGG